MRFAILLLVYKMSKEAKYQQQTRMRSKKDQLQLDTASIQNWSINVWWNGPSKRSRWKKRNSKT
jgi:hypothetical protein